VHWSANKNNITFAITNASCFSTNRSKTTCYRRNTCLLDLCLNFLKHRFLA